MKTLTTKGIKISVLNRYEQDASNPALNRYIHSYVIKIENQSNSTVQLISRFWLITDGDGTKREVSGEGVIGEQPVLRPDEDHTYSSWCPISFPTGKMEGYFNMKDLETLEVFQVAVPAFTLQAPFKQN